MTTGEGDFFIDNVESDTYILTITSPNLVPINQEIIISDGSMNLDTFNMTGYANWDIKNDGIIGLEEAIHALQIAAGVR
jgi:hypothetical protein